jgi:trans-AT polyketide synthase/acyltransferase/oxidoreductase domain-containing protein
MNGVGDTTSFEPAFFGAELAAQIADVRRSYDVVFDSGGRRIGLRASPVELTGAVLAPGSDPSRLGTLPPLYPEWLGDRSFAISHGCRFPYIVGEMARGIATTGMVKAATKAGFLGFFGAAGLAPGQVEAACREIARDVGDKPWGSNLIHSPNEPGLEACIVDLYLGLGVHRVSASAYMAVTPELVRYACRGLRADSDGRVQRSNYLFAKISRPEVAAQFMAPPPSAVLERLRAAGQLTASEVELAGTIPLAEDVTVEADSGGHTDNRPLTVLLPLILKAREAAMSVSGRHIRVGASGGLGAPSAVAAAFGMGAAYVLTGTVNQIAIESGLSPEGRTMLAEAGMSDVVMAPSADMFELGVKVQVLRKGTMFAQRAARLYELYRSYASLDDLPSATREGLEREIFRRPLLEIESDVYDYFGARAPAELERANRDPRHRMALVFRWYLGYTSRWPLSGEASRRLDYQIWCGPAIGAFNTWVGGSFLAEPANRTVAQIGLNLLEGAACVTRAHQARCHGIDVPPAAFDPSPRLLS